MSDKPGNHLLGQSSPYLAAHAHDPVDWHPWGDEAFALARKSRKPILLSIGYQSCHWCHVMQRESFKDADTASYINKHFVAIKVDRELRPDVDHLYMSYVTLATGAGGWPMTVVLSPELLPFFGGTYFPKRAPQGMPSFMEVLESVTLAWTSRPDDIAEASEDALDALESVMRVHQGEIAPAEMALAAANKLLEMADHANGGIGTAPKFPQLPVVNYLLAHHELTGDKDTLTMAEQWVYAMVRGGIYDQAGGGLFRYATDQEWLVPHFEKMLYDSAMLLSTIARLHRLAPSFELAFIAQQTVDFLIRDLGRPGTEGRECDGFYSSLDAESLGVEGGTYLWTYEELEDALEPEDMGIAERQLGATPSGNWHGKTILTRRAGRVRRSEAVDRALRRILELRMEREQPSLIKNTHVEWNALAVKGLFDIGAALGDQDLIDIASGILDWLLAEAVDGDHVSHAIGDPSAEGLEVLADYAAVIAALVAGIDLAGRDDLLPVADRLLDAALERFGSDDGRLFETLVTTELPVRPINADDAPTRSGASTLAQVYHRLRPDDPVGFKLLIEPLGWIMNEAPHLAGGALEVALLLNEPEE